MNAVRLFVSHSWKHDDYHGIVRLLGKESQRYLDTCRKRIKDSKGIFWSNRSGHLDCG